MSDKRLQKGSYRHSLPYIPCLRDALELKTRLNGPQGTNAIQREKYTECITF